MIPLSLGSTLNEEPILDAGASRHPPTRILFIDLLRGLAAVTMIEAHVFNSMLRADLRQSGWFPTLDFLNGLIAPVFLFVSGWVFAFSSERKIEEFRKGGTGLRNQLLRIVFVWALGYALHFPSLSLRNLRLFNQAGGWQELHRVDILHSIAAGLLILLVTRLWIRSNLLWEALLYSSAAFLVAVAPLCWDSNWASALPAILAGYIGDYHRSLFPLLPWLAFLLLGSACSVRFARAGVRGSPAMMQMLAGLGIVLLSSGYMFASYGFPWRYGSENIRVHPFFFISHLGGTLLLLWICWSWEQHRLPYPRWLQILSQESLLVYAGHICILYRVALNGRSLGSTYSKQLGIVECLALMTFLVGVMWAAAKLWASLKKRNRALARGIALASVPFVAVVLG